MTQSPRTTINGIRQLQLFLLPYQSISSQCLISKLFKKQQFVKSTGIQAVPLFTCDVTGNRKKVLTRNG
ncbi:UNVERIFIED_CONTAM: hypothetical protein NCL1_14711 [Trichonephila clavipes]